MSSPVPSGQVCRPDSRSSGDRPVRPSSPSVPRNDRRESGWFITGASGVAGGAGRVATVARLLPVHYDGGTHRLPAFVPSRPACLLVVTSDVVAMTPSTPARRRQDVAPSSDPSPACRSGRAAHRYAGRQTVRDSILGSPVHAWTAIW